MSVMSIFILINTVRDCILKNDEIGYLSCARVVSMPRMMFEVRVIVRLTPWLSGRFRVNVHP